MKRSLFLLPLSVLFLLSSILLSPPNLYAQNPGEYRCGLITVGGHQSCVSIEKNCISGYTGSTGCNQLSPENCHDVSFLCVPLPENTHDCWWGCIGEKCQCVAWNETNCDLNNGYHASSLCSQLTDIECISAGPFACEQWENIPEPCEVQENSYSCISAGIVDGKIRCEVDTSPARYRCLPGYKPKENVCKDISEWGGYCNTYCPACIKDESALNCTTDEREVGINTAIGCLPYTDINPFTIFLLRWAIGLAGGVALLLFIIASFLIIFSQGDPKRLSAGKSLMISAISGVLFLIFAVYLLKFIGYNILNIPFFGP